MDAAARNEMGEGATNFSSEIEYSKLSIIVGLALAAAEISYRPGHVQPDAQGRRRGGDPGHRDDDHARGYVRLSAWAIRRIGEKMAELLTKTMMKTAPARSRPGILRRARAGPASRRNRPGNPGQQRTCRLPVGPVQTDRDRFHGRWWSGRGHRCSAHARDGACPRNRITAGAKGAVTMFTAGVSGNVAGTLSVGGEFDTLSILASSTSTSLGGMKGLGRSHGAAADQPHRIRPGFRVPRHRMSVCGARIRRANSTPAARTATTRERPTAAGPRRTTLPGSRPRGDQGGSGTRGTTTSRTTRTPQSGFEVHVPRTANVEGARRRVHGSGIRRSTRQSRRRDRHRHRGRGPTSALRPG